MRVSTGLKLTASTLVLAIAGTPAMGQTGAGQPAPAQEPGQQADPVAENPEDIVVTGIRRSLQSAQELKRDADQILDAIVAEDIGKLPDNNASEALARVSGVIVGRSLGEANEVRVRGLPDLQTTFNGREIFTGDARRVALQDFPAESLAAVEVFKSTTANQLEGGIAGLLNVRSRRPFDFKGFTVAGSARGLYNTESGKFSPNGSVLVSNRWNTGIGEIGGLLNVAYTQLKFLTSARFVSGNIVTSRAANQAPGTPAIRLPDSVGIFYGRGLRYRPSVVGAFQWRPSADLEFYADGLFQGFRERNKNDSLSVPLLATNQLNQSEPRFSNVVLRDGINAADSLTKTGGAQADLFRGAPKNSTNTYQGGVGAIYSGNNFKLTSDFAYTQSTYTSSDYGFDFATNRAPTVNAVFDVPGDYGVEFDLGDFDTTDPNNYIMRQIFDRNYRQDGESIQWRTDLALNTDWEYIPKIDFGFRYSDREAQLRQGDRGGQIRELQIPVLNSGVGEGGTIDGGFNGSDVQPTRTWWAPNRSDIRSNIDALRTFQLASITTIRDQLVARLAAATTEAQRLQIRRQIGDRNLQIARFDQEVPSFQPERGYLANEKSYAFYGQFRYEIPFSIPIDGVIGARVVNTVQDISGFSRVFTPDPSGIPDLATVNFIPRSASQNFVDILPSASMRIRFTPELQLRLSSTKTRTLPGFGQYNPALNVTRNVQPDGSEIINGNSGNIDLRPLESQNYDASLEWYFSRTGSASLAVFRRDNKNFISTFTRDIPDPEFGTIRLSRPENSESGRIEGVEAAFQTFFDFLPGFARGFGTQLNFTYLDAKFQLPGQGALDLPRVRIPGVSKYAFNVVGLYERGIFGARLAYNRRSQWINFYSFPNDPTQRFAGESTRAVSRLDFSTTLRPVEAITLTFDVSNILGVPFKNFRNFTANDTYPRDARYEGTYYSLGARFRF